VKLANAVEREKFKSSPTISSGMEETLPVLIDSVGSSFNYYNYKPGVSEENRVTAHRFSYSSLAKNLIFSMSGFQTKMVFEIPFCKFECMLLTLSTFLS
jgi:hypothetical protein